MIAKLTHLWTRFLGRLQKLATQTQTRGAIQPNLHFTPEEYKQAALDYPKRLNPGTRYYLYVKPFDTGRYKSYSAQFFHHFANLLEILALPPRAKILDVACGPGWLCEFLACSGYDVTGIDISPDMIEIARERIQAVQFGPYEGQPLQARFLVGDVETTDLGSELYHAAIFYDSLHHFPDPKATLDCTFLSLKPGGKLYIQEGVKPAPGSEAEKKLIEEMNQFGTLEKPFDQPELIDFLRNVGFVNIQAYEAVNLVVKRNGNVITPSLQDTMVPMTNTVLARKPGGVHDSQIPNVLKASISIVGESLPQVVSAGAILQVNVSLKNEGDTLWLSEPSPTGGFVTLGTKLLDRNKRLLSDVLERSVLPNDLPPDQIVTLTHRFTVPMQPGSYWIKLDLVDELITWFEQEGSQPCEFFLQVRA